MLQLSGLFSLTGNCTGKLPAVLQMVDLQLSYYWNVNILLRSWFIAWDNYKVYVFARQYVMYTMIDKLIDK